MTWQPIDTAPKDGTAIMAWCICQTTGDGFFVSDLGFWEPRQLWLSGDHGPVNPTHWMPLPEPPK